MLKPQPICNDQKPITSVILLILLIIVPTLLLSTFLYQSGKGSSIEKNTVRMGEITPQIDGKITYDEWYKGNLYMYPQWLRFNDIDNSKSEWNYLSIGHDSNNLYLSIDMLSITNTLPSEILEIHFITNGKYFTTFSKYMISQNWGVEALIINMTSNTIFETNQLNTIEGAAIETGYNPSVNSDTNHRNIEITIPRTELEFFDGTGELGILIIGNFEGGSYYFAAASPNSNIVHYDSTHYIGVNMSFSQTF